MKSLAKVFLITLFSIGTTLPSGTALAVQLQDSGLELPNLDQIVLTSEKEIPGYILLAKHFLKAGKYQEVVILCEEISILDRNNIAAHAYAAAAYQGLGETDKYQTESDLVKQLAPKSPLLYQTLATLYISLQDFARAEQSYSQGLKVTSGTADLHMGLANLYFEQNRLKESEYHYREVLKQKNLNSQLFLNANFSLCRIKLNNKEYDKVIKRAKILTDLYPPLPQGHLFLGAAYLGKGQPHQAIKVYEKFMEINPKSPVPFQELATIYIDKLGESKKALHYAKEATQKFPQDAKSWDILGWVSFKDKQYQEAAQLFSKATQLEHNNPQYLYHLGLAQQKQGKNIKANKAFKEALAMSDKTKSKTFAAELKNRIEQSK